MSTKKIMNEALKDPTVFKDETTLSSEYTPLELPHRGEEIKKLVQIFKPLITNPGAVSKRVVITGPIGTGKTSIAKSFGAMIEDEAVKRNINLNYIHINCRKYNKPIMVLNRIIRQFNSNFPTRGIPAEDLVIFLSEEIFNREEVYILLCLDDAESLIKAYPSLIYNLTRMGDDNYNLKRRLSLITIAKDENFRDSLDPSTKSSFISETIFLEKYARPQIRDILKKRIKEAFFENTVLKESIELISDFSAESGDARYALELLITSANFADRSQSVQITPEFVRAAKVSLDPEINIATLGGMEVHQKLILKAIAQQLKSNAKAYFTIGDNWNCYQSICQENNTKALTKSEILKHLKDLTDEYKILSTTSPKSEGELSGSSNFRLNVPIRILEGELIEWVDNVVKHSDGEEM